MENLVILIIDDNLVNLRITRFALELEGYRVSTAVDAEDAMRRLGGIRPRLILLDVQLPGMGGLELARKLKDDPVTAPIVIVAMSGFTAKSDEEQALRAGCAGFLPKPIDPMLLPSQLADYLARSTAAPALSRTEVTAVPAPVQTDLLAATASPFFTPSDMTGFGGTVMARSHLPVGTSFEVSNENQPEVFPSTQVSRPDVPVVGAARRGQVLVVDDEPVIGNLVRRFLSRDHDVVNFTTAVDALALINSGQSFDVILCDMMMPGTTGMELYDQLLKSAPEQAERMVFLTGGVFTVSADEFLNSVPNPCVKKPFAIQQLRELVNDLIR